jgi:hypothetical protein
MKKKSSKKMLGPTLQEFELVPVIPIPSNSRPWTAGAGLRKKENQGVGNRIERNHLAERTDAVDRADLAALRVAKAPKPARQLILVVRKGAAGYA